VPCALIIVSNFVSYVHVPWPDDGAHCSCVTYKTYFYFYLFPLNTNGFLATRPCPTHTAIPSHNFQLLFNNAFKAYEKHTKNDLLAHPLAAHLQTCNSPSAILAVLQRQVQDLDQSRTADEKWTRWLNPTVNVLYVLSETLGEGVGLVRLSP
jgi:hypothetical protein